MNYKLAVIPGDGIGPDVVEQTLLVLDKVGEKFGHTFQYHKVLAGGCGRLEVGHPPRGPAAGAGSVGSAQGPGPVCQPPPRPAL